MAPFWTVGILIAVCVVPLRAGSYCSTSYGGRQYCSFGCCSYACCTDTADVETSLAGWVIGVIVSGSLVFISIVIALIRCCVKALNKSERVVSTQLQPQPGVTVVSSGQQQGSYGNQGFVHNSGNPGYTQAWGYPPGQSAPAPPPYAPGQATDPSPFQGASSSKN